VTSEKDDLLNDVLVGKSKRKPDTKEQGSSDGQYSDMVNEETFGVGVNQKVLLVTKGVSLKKIVESSK
jgi:hypothetical protein